jgi:hypothetical protein
MKKYPCCECEGKRDFWRAVAQLTDGTIRYCCRQCWRRLAYDDFMGPSSPK